VFLIEEAGSSRTPTAGGTSRRSPPRGAPDPRRSRDRTSDL